MPGAVPHSSTYALTNATLPYAVTVATKGGADAIRLDPALAAGVNTIGGCVTNAAVATALGRSTDHLDDVLTRRTRISIETFDRGTTAARPAADLMAAELGWDERRRDDEVDHYLRRVEAERQSQRELSDQEADEARVSAPDIV
jgi:glycerol-3-phosphate dehydrogenase